MLIFCALIVSLLTTTAFYLTSPHQQWRKRPLAARPWRWIAVLGLAASLLFWMSIMDSKAGFFAGFAAIMLWAGLVPFVHLLRPQGMDAHAKKS